MLLNISEVLFQRVHSRILNKISYPCVWSKSSKSGVWLIHTEHFSLDQLSFEYSIAILGQQPPYQTVLFQNSLLPLFALPTSFVISIFFLLPQAAKVFSV